MTTLKVWLRFNRQPEVAIQWNFLTGGPAIMVPKLRVRVSENYLNCINLIWPSEIWWLLVTPKSTLAKHLWIFFCNSFRWLFSAFLTSRNAPRSCDRKVGSRKPSPPPPQSCSTKSRDPPWRELSLDEVMTGKAKADQKLVKNIMAGQGRNRAHILSMER